MCACVDKLDKYYYVQVDDIVFAIGLNLCFILWRCFEIVILSGCGSFLKNQLL